MHHIQSSVWLGWFRHYSKPHGVDAYGDPDENPYLGTGLNHFTSFLTKALLTIFRDLAFDPGASSSVVEVSCGADECQCGPPACGCSDKQQCTYSRSYGAKTQPNVAPFLPHGGGVEGMLRTVYKFSVMWQGRNMCGEGGVQSYYDIRCM